MTDWEGTCIVGTGSLRRSFFPGLKGYWWDFGVATMDAEKIKQLSTFPGLLEDPSVVVLMYIEVQQLLIATLMLHQWCYGTKQNFLVREFAI